MMPLYKEFYRQKCAMQIGFKELFDTFVTKYGKS